MSWINDNIHALVVTIYILTGIGMITLMYFGFVRDKRK